VKNQNRDSNFFLFFPLLLCLLRLLGGGVAAVDLDVERNGVRTLATLASDDAAVTLALADELEALQRLACPVERAGCGADGALGL